MTKTKPETKYTIDYFIKKFSAIPSKKWTTGTYDNGKGQKCALGHCGASEKYGPVTYESQTLSRILWELAPVSNINDGISASTYRPKGKSPRTRILNALRLCKKAGRE